MEHADTANRKLLFECEVLLDRLKESSGNFLSEDEDRLMVDPSSPSDALDLLTTSDNRIGLRFLLAVAPFPHSSNFFHSDPSLFGRRC